MSSAPETINLHRPTFAEIDVAAFRRNVRAARRWLPESSRLIAMLKANAYGHGALELARACMDEDAEMIGVAMLEEALELKGGGVTLPLLILGPLDKDQVHRAVVEQFVIGVVGPDELLLIDEVTRQSGASARLHLKLDTGMNRMGLKESDLPLVVNLVRTNPLMQVDAIYTHFANASIPGDPLTETQLADFSRLLGVLESHGLTASLHHTSNSAATMRGLVRPGDYARIGLALFGGAPVDGTDERLEPVMTLRSRVARVKAIRPGEVVGYGATFTARRHTILATVPIGYADGYDRLLSNRGVALVRGQRVPVVGRVSMDLITLDVTDVDVVAVGDPVVLLGRQGNEEVTAEEIAGLTGTISYEVFCAVSSRVPRLFRDGEEVKVVSKFDSMLGEVHR